MKKVKKLMSFVLVRAIINSGELMKITIGNFEINYIQYGSGKDIILLHGWGQNIEMMQPLGDRLQKKFRITILDFPGFGSSPEPRCALTINDYTEMLEEFLSKLKIKSPIVIGHSFGGRVGINYASRNKVEKLILFGSPCVRTKKEVDLKVKVLKTMKKVPILNKLEGFAKKHMGSRDYRNASDIMRKTLVNVVNQDLSNEAKKIKVPTLLIWGDKDTEAPLEDAKLLEGLIADCGLIVFPNCSHYAYLENLGQVISILNNFL